MSETDPTRNPASKAGRQAAIETILTTQAITSQPQLRQALEEVGISAAQATLSRDLLQMRATKVRAEDGQQIYALPNSTGATQLNDDNAETRLQRWAQDLLVAAASTQNLAVLRTPAGAANLLGSALDAVRDESVLGTVAGDDTILVVCTGTDEATQFCERMLAWAEGGKP